ncbi:hypothetical protein K737_301086 [Holospora undulata HU1]|uniref:Uncharacterized protein n=1 Tax=Holospora undulata HU1 TaxID=1321371 RepID=A0A061JH29_9PROT|nr:hypothetical protein K737_301086 [Holospora undulata HU1]
MLILFLFSAPFKLVLQSPSKIKFFVLYWSEYLFSRDTLSIRYNQVQALVG